MRRGRVARAATSVVGFFDSVGKIVGAIAAVVALGVTLGVITLRGGGEQPQKAELAVPELVVKNPQPAFKQTLKGGVQTAASLPAIEVTLHNVGRRRSIVTGAHFRVLRVEHLKVCATAGDLGVARSYGVALPTTPSGEAVVSSEPLRRQLAPDEAEVLRFRFSLDNSSATGQFVYQLALDIVHDNEARPVQAGTAIVSVPSAPDQEQLMDRTKASQRDVLVRTWSEPAVRCFESNTARLRGILRAKGARDPQLKAVAGKLP